MLRGECYVGGIKTIRVASLMIMFDLGFFLSDVMDVLIFLFETPGMFFVL